MVDNFGSDRGMLDNKLEEVKEYTLSRKFPHRLQQDMLDYYEQRYEEKLFDEAKILSELNPILRCNIIDFNCYDLIRKCGLFKYCNSNFIHRVMSKLSYECYSAGDLIIKEGLQGRRMFFIDRGSAIVLSDKFRLSQFLKPGSYFGETCLIAPFAKRMANVYAETVETCVYTLSTEDFEEILEYSDLEELEDLLEGAKERFGFRKEEQNETNEPGSKSKNTAPGIQVSTG